MYLKINNIKTQTGQIDYKGLDIEKFIPGSQVYPQDLRFCLVETLEVTSESEDVVVLSVEEYNNIKELTLSEVPKDPLLEQIELMQLALDELLLNGGM